MRPLRWRVAAVVGGTALLALVNQPAHAGSTSTPDAIGVDYDAACVANSATTAPGPNSFTTNGCPGVSLHDGSTDSTDLTGYSLGSDTAGRIVATFQIRGDLPAPGSTVPPDGTPASYNLPSAAATGAAYFSLFQNKGVASAGMPVSACAGSLGNQCQVSGTGNPSPSPTPGGCTRVGSGTPVPDTHGAWQDGFHFYTNLVVNWDGRQWIHTVHIGEYDPRPNGGLPFYPMGHNEGFGWLNSSPYMIKGTDWDISVTTGSNTTVTVWVKGVFRTPDTANCQEGHFTHVFATPGSVIANAKALTTTNMAVTLPVVVPFTILCGVTSGAVCASDLKTVGGYVSPSDTTAGNSNAGLAGLNISNIAYTRSAHGHGSAANQVLDTLGEGPSCPTPTLGGVFPQNPLYTPGVACLIDDDNVARGSSLAEMWETTLGFIF